MEEIGFIPSFDGYHNTESPGLCGYPTTAARGDEK
jgi:hypothetical protein